ncbi:MAG: LacI family DNA-binding transcriptional regulator [Blautia marasmi]
MTIKEIASLAGVSISTVSKIVNNKDENINPETRSRVLKIVKEYNYTPYGMVKNISSAKSFLLGVLLRTALTDQSDAERHPAGSSGAGLQCAASG